MQHFQFKIRTYDWTHITDNLGLREYLIDKRLGCGGHYAKKENNSIGCQYNHRCIYQDLVSCHQFLSPEFNDGKLTSQYSEWKKEFQNNGKKLCEQIEKEIIELKKNLEE